VELQVKDAAAAEGVQAAEILLSVVVRGSANRW
jgi:hypothetical protein